MQILVVGKGAKEYALARKIKESEAEHIVFVAPGNQAIGEFATCVDIQPDNIKELVEFAEANEINLTVVCDEAAIKADITDAFNSAGLMIFAPDREAARIAAYKSVGKRFMYKLKMNTPKFGIFDKENTAREYVRTAEFPILIKYDEHIDGERVFLCHSAREANKILNKIFAIDTPKIVIENYVQGREFSFYAITDGYNALPIISVVPYKYSSEKDGGSITKGIGAYAPAVFADKNIEEKILGTIIYPAINEIARNSEPYVGIIGADLILDSQNKIWTIEFNTFFNEPDIECILELLDENITELLKACCIGSLADDYPSIKTFNKFAVSSVAVKIAEHLFDKEQSEVKGLEEVEDEVIVTLYNALSKDGTTFAKAGRALSLTKSAATLTKAKKCLAENMEQVNFKGKKYRKDITDTVND